MFICPAYMCKIKLLKKTVLILISVYMYLYKKKFILFTIKNLRKKLKSTRLYTHRINILI